MSGVMERIWDLNLQRRRLLGDRQREVSGVEGVEGAGVGSEAGVEDHQHPSGN